MVSIISSPDTAVMTDLLASVIVTCPVTVITSPSDGMSSIVLFNVLLLMM
jgi:hypothetical protein